MKMNQFLIDFYNNYDEDNRLVLKHESVEFLTTMHYIEKYIRPGDCVIEIGAGTGRYSHTLAHQGYNIDAVELVEHNIEIFHQNTQSNENITISQGNAMDLSEFSDNQYDITLLLGPMYHLYTIEDKRQALKEAIRVTKPGGVIFVAYVISDICILDEGFNRNNINIEKYIEEGLIDAQTFGTKSFGCDLVPNV